MLQSLKSALERTEPPVAATHTGKIPVVEYLRGLASLAVAWLHVTYVYGLDGASWVSACGSLGWLGVDVFFVISGFIVPYSIARAYPCYRIADFPHFCLKRLARLEPPYIVSLALALVVVYASPLAPGFQGQPFDLTFGQVAAHFFYLIPFTHFAWLQGVYWTLVYEFVFYLLIGVAFPLVCTRGSRLAWIAVVTAFVSLTSCGFLPARALLFVIGMSVFRRIVLADLLALTSLTMAECAAVIACSEMIAGQGGPLSACAGIASAAAMLFGINFRFKGTCGGKLGACLAGLATISYSLYLTHDLIGRRIVRLGKRFIEFEWQQFELSLLALFVSLAFGVVFWSLIERPAINFAEKLKDLTWFRTILSWLIDCPQDDASGRTRWSNSKIDTRMDSHVYSRAKRVSWG